MRFEVGRLGAAGDFMQCGVRSMRRGLTRRGKTMQRMSLSRVAEAYGGNLSGGNGGAASRLRL